MSHTKVQATTAIGDVSNSIDRDNSHDQEDEEKTTSPWRKVVGWVWESAEGTPRNRKYVHKIDGYMLYVEIIHPIHPSLDLEN